MFSWIRTLCCDRDFRASNTTHTTHQYPPSKTGSGTTPYLHTLLRLRCTSIHFTHTQSISLSSISLSLCTLTYTLHLVLSPKKTSVISPCSTLPTLRLPHSHSLCPCITQVFLRAFIQVAYLHAYNYIRKYNRGINADTLVNMLHIPISSSP